MDEVHKETWHMILSQSRQCMDATWRKNVHSNHLFQHVHGNSWWEKCIKKWFWLSTNGFWLQIRENWQPKWYIYAITNHELRRTSCNGWKFVCVCVCVLENLEQGGTWHYCHCMMNVVDVCWDGFCWVVICSTCKIWELMHAIKSWLW